MLFLCMSIAITLNALLSKANDFCASVDYLYGIYNRDIYKLYPSTLDATSVHFNNWPTSDIPGIAYNFIDDTLWLIATSEDLLFKFDVEPIVEKSSVELIGAPYLPSLEWVNGVLYAGKDEGSQPRLYIIDETDGSYVIKPIQPFTAGSAIGALAYDCQNDIMYATIAGDINPSQLISIDFRSQQSELPWTKIMDLPDGKIGSLSYGPGRSLYAATTGGSLYTIDISGPSAQYIGRFNALTQPHLKGITYACSMCDSLSPTQDPISIKPPTNNPSKYPTEFPTQYPTSTMPTTYNPTSAMSTTNYPTTTMPATNYPTNTMPTTYNPTSTITAMPTMNYPTWMIPTTVIPTTIMPTTVSTDIISTNHPSQSPSNKPTQSRMNINTPTAYTTTAYTTERSGENTSNSRAQNPNIFIWTLGGILLMVLALIIIAYKLYFRRNENTSKNTAQQIELSQFTFNKEQQPGAITLESFLGSIELMEYYNVFVNNGFGGHTQANAQLLELNDDDLKDMGIKLGHRKLILKKLERHEKVIENEAHINDEVNNLNQLERQDIEMSDQSESSEEMYEKLQSQLNLCKMVSTSTITVGTDIGDV
eukprot:30730_1